MQEMPVRAVRVNQYILREVLGLVSIHKVVYGILVVNHSSLVLLLTHVRVAYFPHDVPEYEVGLYLLRDAFQYALECLPIRLQPPLLVN